MFRANQDGLGAADSYLWKNGALTLNSTIRVSMTMAELSQQGKVTAGTLRSGEPALFVTGVAEGMRAITDVLLLRGGELNNAVLPPTTGVSGESSRFRALYPADINGDGVTEVPRTAALYGEELEGEYFLPLELHRLDAGHADILQHLEVIQVVVGEGHPEARPADALYPCSADHDPQRLQPGAAGGADGPVYSGPE